MLVSGYGLLERIGFKANSKCEVKISLIDGKDSNGKAKYVSVILNANMEKCEGLFETEQALKVAQSSNPDFKLLCKIEAIGMLSSARVSKCNKYVNLYGLLLSISEKEKKRKS
ncbi:hypothetical protein [Pseudoalteromonas luteoviolacea]|uniref:Uncharacterized protein n=1 Tax=Pseudoalteromonas luteoviolacea S4060-1 TaxID=1365257 RepID=A0A162C7B8_9GAMM|nr:hypothetical protein [Pseudoalteromonas luteoviolacea]KZN63353.1 hypothetical protein N478_03630 [Pseudoalteromonas luteoviolacea S4060-1]